MRMAAIREFGPYTPRRTEGGSYIGRGGRYVCDQIVIKSCFRAIFVLYVPSTTGQAPTMASSQNDMS